MSRENVEICRRVAEFLGGGNPTAGVEAALEYADPEIVFESAIVSQAEGGAYRGHDGLRAWAADYEAASMRREPRRGVSRPRRSGPHAGPRRRARARKRGCGRVPDGLPDHLAKAGSSTSRAFSTGIRPSKPPGCRSRQ